MLITKANSQKILLNYSIFLLGLTFTMMGCNKVYDIVGGNFRGNPDEMAGSLSLNAKKLIEEAFKDINSNQIVDYHVHIVGFGKTLKNICRTDFINNSSLYLNPIRFSWQHPLWMIKTRVLMSASKITSAETANEQYARRLLKLVRNIRGRGKFFLLALDGYYEKDGSLNLKRTDALIPNQYVIELTACLNKKLNDNQFPSKGRFVPAVSIHPYRKDAIEKLRRYHAEGIRAIKWLPNVMNINPASKKIDGFYREMARLKMLLITHTGNESALRGSSELQKYGNPQLLRRALDLGVIVIMAHSGREGSNIDKNGKQETNFNLFLQMMKEPRYTNCLFGELSSLTIRDRNTLDHLKTVMENPDLQDRMVNGSDYPLPAVDFLNPTGLLAAKKYITRPEKHALDEIYSFNPMLFDFVLKRTIRHPKQQKLRLPASMFLSIKSHQKNNTTCSKKRTENLELIKERY